MLIDFARLPTVQSDDEEKYAYLDYQHGVEWGPVQALKFGVKYTDHDRGSLWMSTDGGAFLPLACGAAPCTAADFVGGTTPDDFLANIAQPDTLTDYWTVDRAALETIFRSQPERGRAAGRERVGEYGKT